MRRLALVAALAACGDNAAPSRPFCDTWQQWGIGPGHDGSSCVVGQPLERVLADVTIDPFVDAEKRDADGDLVIHYQSPLLSRDMAFEMRKGGTYTPCATKMMGAIEVPDCFEPDELHRLDSQVWTEVGFAWDGDQLVQRWAFDSDWKPVPGQLFEPMFQPALVGDRIAVPGASGSVWLLDAATGRVVLHVVPFGDDPDTYVAGGIAVDAGALFYNAVTLDHDAPLDGPTRGTLVAIDDAAGDIVRLADYAKLVPGAPRPDMQCYTTYDFTTTMAPYPPLGADGKPLPPLSARCGGQVPGINSAPAFGPGGTVYLVAHAQFNEAYSYVIAVDPDALTPKWATSMRGLVHDGCGDLRQCTPGAPRGVDPFTGLPPALFVDDSSSSSPVALRGGGVLYGALDDYNRSRGHLIELADDGRFVASFDFGWDTTPAVVFDGKAEHVVMKDNHYNFDPDGTDAGPYFITELDDQLQPTWRFLSTETQSCTRQSDGSLACVEDHPHGFEWCINAPAIDRDGTTYVNSEDGHLYAIDKTGQLRDKLFLEAAVGAAYTPLALDPAGRIYSLNSGHLLVVGSGR